MAAVAVVALLGLPACTGSTGEGQRLDLRIEKYALGNGLEVILHKDDRLPVAAVNLWYHVGPANEVEGRRGFAHLFEHIMFEGSGHVARGVADQLLEAAGTFTNGSTGFDSTNYIIPAVPSDQLELALWLESDRMGFLLDRVDQASLSTQQAVVRNERRQVVEGTPYGLAQEKTLQLLFPEQHPYHANIIGSHEDIQAARLDDVRGFFRRYYVPNNASLAIAGNIDVEDTRALVEKYFGTIPRGADVPEPEVEVPVLTGEQRAVVTDTVTLERVTLAWVTPPAFTPGDAEAAVTARILAGSAASRLHRRLVHDRNLAQEVRASQQSLAHGSVFSIEALAKPGRSAGELETVVDEEIEALAAEGPSGEEVEAATSALVSEIVMSLENLGDFGGRADRLNLYNHYLGEPEYLHRDLDRFTSVTTGAVRDFVAGRLGRDGRVVVHAVPGDKQLPPDPPEPPPPPEEDIPAVESREPWRHQVPEPGPAPPMRTPPVERFTLDNGLPVYLVESHTLPIVSASVVSRRGSAADPPSLPGLAGFTLSMMDQGTEGRDAPELARELEHLGASLTAAAGRDGSRVSVRSLGHQARGAVALLAEVVRSPAFRPPDVERVRDERLVALQRRSDDPAAVADTVMWRILYGDGHPYGHTELGTEDGLRAVEGADLEEFHAGSFTPAGTALVLAGDLTAGEARTLAGDAFSTWTGGGQEGAPAPTGGAEAPERVIIVDRPGSTQTALAVAQRGVGRSHPDFEKLTVMNQILGGLFSSRLNQNLREERGYTYGAYSRVYETRGPGPIRAATSVEAQFTGPSVREVLAEMAAIRESDVTHEELRRGTESISRAVPLLFETNDRAAETLGDLYLLDLPADHYDRLAARLAAVTAADVREVASRYLRPEGAKVIAVGDASTILSQLGELGLGGIGYRAPDGRVA